MESRTYIKNVRVTPKKLRLYVGQIAKSRPHQVLHELYYSPQKSARILYKAIQAAIASAKQGLKVDDDALVFKQLVIEEGQKIKRFRPGGRGGVKPYVRRFSHIKIILGAKKSQLSSPSVKEKEEKKSVMRVEQPKEKQVKKSSK